MGNNSYLLYLTDLDLSTAAGRAEALARVSDWIAGQGWTVRATVDSPIEGGDGNREYLLWATRA